MLDKQEILNKVELNVQNGIMDVVYRVSFYEDGEEIHRDHITRNYSFENEHEIVSQSQLVQNIWGLLSGSYEPI